MHGKFQVNLTKINEFMVIFAIFADSNFIIWITLKF